MNYLIIKNAFNLKFERFDESIFTWIIEQNKLKKTFIFISATSLSIFEIGYNIVK